MGITNFLLISLVLSATAEYTTHRREILDPDGKYELNWDIDYENKMVRFNASVETNGYVGFGISPTGGMANADIVIGGVHENGSEYFRDYHGTGFTAPVEDQEINWFLEDAENIDGYTNLVFRRLFDTCDDQDIILSNDTTSFIWSIGADDNIVYHEVRGALTVQPLDPETPFVNLTSYSKYEITHTMLMPPADTTYWCTIHKSPIFTSKHHIVAFEPILSTPEAIAHTHHYNIFRCKAPDGQTNEEFFEPFINHTGGECYVEKPEIPTEYCQTMFYNWAVGGRMLILPENIGYPIGETGNAVDYYMFEIHYNNPQELNNVTFETGANIYYTNETRTLDAGLMVVAHHTSISLTVPPQSPHFKTVGHCSSECTTDYLPEDGINVFAVFLHAHMSGRRMKFRQFRDGQELPWIASDDTYDFEYQQTRLLHKELKIERGDHLTMECIYDNTWINGTVIGGLSTSNEMCQSIFWYWPRAELRDCRSELPIEEVFAKFEIISANRSTMYENAIITAPEQYLGMKYTDVLNQKVVWTDALREELQMDAVNNKHVGVCWTDTETKHIEETSYPSISSEYKPERECNPTSEGTIPTTENTSATSEKTTEETMSTTENSGPKNNPFYPVAISLTLMYMQLL